MSKREYPDLFSLGDGSFDWRLNACLNFTQNSSHGYIEGYRRAAELLIEHVGEERHEIDYLIYPIVFMYRQHLELQLKTIILHARRLLQKKEIGYPKNHNLTCLWELAKGLAKEVWADQEIPPEFAAADHFIGQFSTVDPDSMAFRYSESKDGSPSLPGLQYVNLGHLQECMNSMLPLLDGVSCGLQCMLDEMERYADDIG